MPLSNLNHKSQFTDESGEGYRVITKKKSLYTHTLSMKEKGELYTFYILVSELKQINFIYRKFLNFNIGA